MSTSYAVGTVSGTTGVGGLIGTAHSATTSNAYRDTQSTGQASSADSTGPTTLEMQGSSAPSNMGGFDFSSTWETIENPDDYPELQSTG